MMKTTFTVKCLVRKINFILGILFLLVIFYHSDILALESDSLYSVNDKTSESGYSFSIAYWNDNFLFDKELNRLFNKNIFQTEDDFITASFWIRISKVKKLSRWLLDSYLNVATNRGLNFRTDFISFRLTYETYLKYGLFRIGGGFISNGNFGGSQIQNYYHKTSSIEKLILPYLNKSNIGLSVHSTFKPILLRNKNFQFNGAISSSLYTGDGPSSVELGFEGVYTAIENQLVFNLYVGYKNYLIVKPKFDSLFGKGIIWGFFSTLKISSGIQSSVWVTGNQYGKGNQNHFGISFTFSTQKIIPVVFEDVKIP